MDSDLKGEGAASALMDEALFVTISGILFEGVMSQTNLFRNVSNA